jgi:hypothetical protein
MQRCKDNPFSHQPTSPAPFLLSYAIKLINQSIHYYYMVHIYNILTRPFQFFFSDHTTNYLITIIYSMPQLFTTNKYARI